MASVTKQVRPGPGQPPCNPNCLLAEVVVVGNKRDEGIRMQESGTGSANLAVVDRTHCVEHMSQRAGPRFERCGCLRRRRGRVSERNHYSGPHEPCDRHRGALHLWSDGYE